MAAATESRILVTIVTFLAAFFILVMTIPSSLVASPQQGRVVDVPEYFEGIDIQSYADIYAINLTATDCVEYDDFDFGGWKMHYEDWGFSPYPYVISIYTYSKWWIFEWDYQYFHWHDREGINRSQMFSFGAWGEKRGVSYEALDNAYEDFGEDGLRWTLKNVYTQMVVYVGFNQSAYDSPSEALNAGDCSLLLCMNFDQMNTSFNAWNLIGALLFFQLPNVHPAINALIAIPIWVMIAYLIYVLILKAIPFVGG